LGGRGTKKYKISSQRAESQAKKKTMTPKIGEKKKKNNMASLPKQRGGGDQKNKRGGGFCLNRKPKKKSAGGKGVSLRKKNTSFLHKKR